QASQEGDGGHGAFPYRQADLHEVLPAVLDELPVDAGAWVGGEQGVDMPVAHLGIGAVEGEVLEVAYPRQQVDAEQVGESEDREGLALGVGVYGVRPDLRLVRKERVDEVDGFPHPAGDEPGEERNVGVGDEMVGDPAVAAVADRGLGEEVVDDGV